MDIQEEKYNELIQKYNSGYASPEETAWLESWYLNLGQERAPLDREELDVAEPVMWNAVQQQIGAKRTIRLWPKLIAAAAIICAIAGTSLFFYYRNVNTGIESNYANDIEPGKNGATLTLANGAKIQLTSARSGELAKQAGVSITKSADGEIEYTILERAQENGETNILSTDRGQTYKVRLPDGSSVWLNAASELRYPANFSGQKARRVELSGEAYFEIFKDPAKPFIVKTEKQEVEVLGTHFNIDSYADEPAIRTTLLEGKVKVRQGAIEKTLRPGQQATVAAGQFSIGETDAENAIAWKNGLFIFQAEPLESIMRKISRWYNVEVIYQNVDPSDAYGGSVSRYDKVSKVLEKLEQTGGGIHFKIQGRRVTVMK